jgi:hypothetical protein
MRLRPFCLIAIAKARPRGRGSASGPLLAPASNLPQAGSVDQAEVGGAGREQGCAGATTSAGRRGKPFEQDPWGCNAARARCSDTASQYNMNKANYF